MTLQRYLERSIPLVRAIGCRVDDASDGGVTIAAPLAPNVNHQGTAFGGSIAALATLACWGWVWTMVGSEARIVVAHSTIDYLKPVTTDFTARCDAPDAERRAAFLERFERKGRAKLTLAASITDADGQVCADFEGVFAVRR